MAVVSAVKSGITLVQSSRFTPLQSLRYLRQTSFTMNSSQAVSRSLAAEIQDANDRHAGILEIRRTVDNRGWGLYACQPFLPGQRVMKSRATQLLSQDKHSVQTGWNSHVHMDLPARFINHVCSIANVGIRPNQNEPTPSYDFFALRLIQTGEELLWDYECSEYEISSFECKCGALACRGELRGFKYHSNEVLGAYGENYVAPYLLEVHPTNPK